LHSPDSTDARKIAGAACRRFNRIVRDEAGDDKPADAAHVQLSLALPLIVTDLIILANRRPV